MKLKISCVFIFLLVPIFTSLADFYEVDIQSKGPSKVSNEVATAVDDVTIKAFGVTIKCDKVIYNMKKRTFEIYSTQDEGKTFIHVLSVEGKTRPNKTLQLTPSHHALLSYDRLSFPSMRS